MYPAPKHAITLALLVAAAFVLAAGCSSGGDGGDERGGGGRGGADAGIQPFNCGNRKLDDGEDCDDGNAAPGDGCELNCRFTCGAGDEGSAECSNFLPCDGREACSTEHTCGPGTRPPDGSPCGVGSVCRSGECQKASLVCGDDIVIAPEECEDGNALPGDGCVACKWECTSTDPERDCRSSNLCRANGSCNDATHACVLGAALPDGTSCGDAVICRGGQCVSVLCGNGRVDAGEECDDRNTVAGDGCNNDCRYSCVSSDASRSCATGDVCAGTSSCNDSTHRCSAATPLPDNTACGTNRYCVKGRCTLAVCGNARKEASEECDDGNSNDQDGCKLDCTFSCETAADCNDNKLCTANVCSAHVCTNPPDTTQNGAACSEGAVSGKCQNGVCTPAQCGDGRLDSGEECDKGSANGPGSGCTRACRFECSTDAACSDGNLCNGSELCAAVTGGRTCRAGTPPAVGFVCATSPRSVCDSARVCRPSVCGDRYVDAALSEQCDDGNTNAGDGCRNDCRFTCSGATECDDGNPCTQNTCNTGTHVCANPADTTKNGQACNGGVCDNGVCRPNTCGNGTLEAGEECDRGTGNGVGTGCVGCQFECDTSANCSNGNACDGTETCQTVSGTGGGRKCSAGAPPALGSQCQASPRRICDGNRQCVLSTCGDAFTDTAGGEQCDKGSGNGPGSGCVSCQFECQSDANCLDNNVCDGSEICASVSGGRLCRAGSNAPRGTVCNASPRSVCNDSGVCLQSICGDGYLDSGTAPAEECDRGSNNGPGTGCSSTCQNECDTAANCDDGNACDGTEACNAVSGGGRRCAEGSALANGTVCQASPRRICLSNSCNDSVCGDGYVDSGRSEQCELPGSFTCDASCQNKCDLAGLWALRIETDVTWGSTLAVASGSGQIVTWGLVTRTYTSGEQRDSGRPCGIVIPPFRGSLIAGSENYALDFPDSIFYDHVLPSAVVDFTTTGVVGGNFRTVGSAVSLIGATLSPAAQPWPSRSTLISNQVNHDADGDIGITAVSRSSSGYSRVPVDGLRLFRADRVFLAVRQIAAFDGTLSSCTEIAGAATVTSQDSHVLGCHVSGGSNCNSGQRDFVDNNRVVHQVGAARFRMVKLAAGSTCATVRTTLP